MSYINKNVDIKFNAHVCNNLHQVRSKSKDWNYWLMLNATDSYLLDRLLTYLAFRPLDYELA